MSTVHLPARRVAFSFVCLSIVVVISACFEPDVEALQDKMQGECRISPPAPNCSRTDGEATALVYERYFLERVDSQAEQDCMLAVECNPEDTSNTDVQELGDCLSLEVDVLGALESRPDQECALECENAVFECGGDAESCGVDVVEGCLAEQEACRAACPRR